MTSYASPTAAHRGQDLGTIKEDSQNSERTKSLRLNTSGIETSHFNHTSAGPKRSFTAPQSFPGPERETVSIDNGVPRARTTGGESRLSKFLNLKGIVSNRTPKRQSTSYTHSSVVTNASASFEETAVWDQKVLLALDGGGIRGYSTLLILKALMEEIGSLETNHPDGPAKSSFHPLSPAPSIATDSESVKIQNPVEAQTKTSPWLPCHYFDYTAGTSTGGLISIMLGRLRMNVDDCIRDYEYFGERVFGHSRWFHIRSPLFWLRDKYDHRVLEAAVQKVVDRRVPQVASFPGGRSFAFDENRCRSVVISYQRQPGHVVEKPYIFRTYKNLHRGENTDQKALDRNPGLAHDIPIWQVARATSAAPAYFEPSKIGDLEYLDGGMGANNPSEEIYDEVRRMNNGSNNCVRVILSIGTGRNHKTARFSGQGISRYWHYVNWAKKWATDSEEAHLRMLKKRQSESESERFWYLRLNVEEGLDDMKLDEWRVRGTLRTTIGQAIKCLRSLKKSGPHTINDNEARSDKDSAAGKTDGNLSTAKTLPESTVPAWFQPKNMTLDSIRAKTSAYLNDEKVRKELRECAKILVHIRRSRGKRDPQRWERACFGTWYQCRVAGCQRGEKEYDRREALMNHLKDKHSASFKGTAGWDMVKLNETLDKFKIIVR